jgi:hypothetical protein
MFARPWQHSPHPGRRAHLAGAGRAGGAGACHTPEGAPAEAAAAARRTARPVVAAAAFLAARLLQQPGAKQTKGRQGLRGGRAMGKCAQRLTQQAGTPAWVGGRAGV